MNDLAPEARLRALGLTLPSVPPPVANFVNATRTGDLLFLSGQGPTRNGKPVFEGKLGENLSEEEGYNAAKLCVLNALAVMQEALGSIDKVRKVVKLLGFVASTTDFVRQPYVINGASDLLADVFGEAGRHTRSAIGTNVLPFNIPVEIEMVVEVL